MRYLVFIYSRKRMQALTHLDSDLNYSKAVYENKVQRQMKSTRVQTLGAVT